MTLNLKNKIQGHTIGKSVGLELLRRFATSRNDQLVERLTAKRLAPGDDQTATLCVGAPSRFEFVPLPRSPTVTFPDGETPEESPTEPQTYTAVWWELEDVRVENPEDSEQYVNTKRILQARYRRPDGSEVQLDNRPIFTAIGGGS